MNNWRTIMWSPLEEKTRMRACLPPSPKQRVLSTPHKAACQAFRSGSQVSCISHGSGFWSCSGLGSNPEPDMDQLCASGYTPHVLCPSAVPSTKWVWWYFIGARENKWDSTYKVLSEQWELNKSTLDSVFQVCESWKPSTVTWIFLNILWKYFQTYIKI